MRVAYQGQNSALQYTEPIQRTQQEGNMRSARRALAAIVLLSSVAAAQQYVISTYAGGAPPHTPARGVDVPIGFAQGVAADGAGNAYFASFDLNSVFKVDPSGVLTLVAGNAR